MVWAGAQRGAKLTLIAQPYAESAWHVVRTRVPWDTLVAYGVVAAHRALAQGRAAAEGSRRAVELLWDQSKEWGERGVVLGKALGLTVGSLLYRVGVAGGAAGRNALVSLGGAAKWAGSGAWSVCVAVAMGPINLGRFIVYLPWNFFTAARDLSRFFKDNQEALADIIATLIGLYILLAFLGVLFGPIVVKMGWMSYDTLDALGLGELCVSLGLLRRPGWFSWH